MGQPGSGHGGFALLAREHAGVAVQVFHLTDETLLRVVDADGETVTPVPNDKALDAFDHPYLYRRARGRRLCTHITRTNT